MPTVFEELRADHDVQRRLLDLLSKTHGDSRGRQELFERLRTAALDHAKHEERVLYAPLIQTTAQDKARHSIHEHHELEEQLTALAEMDFSSTGWLNKLATFRDALLHHLDEEEHEFFQIAGRALDDASKARMADELRKMRDAAAP